MLKPHDRIFLRLDTIPDRDGRTDGQTNGNSLASTAL